MAIISHSRRFIFVKPRKVAGSAIEHALAALCGEDDVRSVLRPAPGLDAFTEIPARNAEWGDRHGFVPPHLLPERIRERVGERVWEDYFKITVCRNPWDLFVSMCWFVARMPLPKFDLHRIPIRIFKDLRHERGLRSERARNLLRLAIHSAFRAPLRRRLEAGRSAEAVEFALRRRMFAGYLSEVPKFYFCGGKPFADYTIRFDRLEDDFREVRRLLGHPVPEDSILPKIRTEARPREEDYRACYTEWSKARVEEACRPMIEWFGYRFDRPGPRFSAGYRKGGPSPGDSSGGSPS